MLYVPVTIIMYYSSLISELTIHISHSVTDFDRSICLLVMVAKEES